MLSILIIFWLQFVYKRKYDRDMEYILKKYSQLLTFEESDLLRSSPGIFLPRFQFSKSTSWDFSASLGWVQTGLMVNCFLSLINKDILALFLSGILLLYSFMSDISSYFLEASEEKNVKCVVARFQKLQYRTGTFRNVRFKEAEELSKHVVSQNYNSLLEKLNQIMNTEATYNKEN